jgi:hypothetical protein
MSSSNHRRELLRECGCIDSDAPPFEKLPERDSTPFFAKLKESAQCRTALRFDLNR